MNWLYFQDDFCSLNHHGYIYNPPWKNLYKINRLGVRFYRNEAGRPVFTIEWYLDCAHAVYIPKSDTKLEALQNPVFYSIGGLFPNHLDFSFYSGMFVSFCYKQWPV